MGILFDVASPGLIFVLLGGGAVLLCGVVIGIILVEALVLYFMKWGSFKLSLLDAFLMNIVSTIAGGLVIALTQQPVIFLIVSFVASILIEGAVLTLLHRASGKRTWLVALVANLVTYALLGPITLISYYGLLSS